MKVNLLHLHPSISGGAMSFAVHLMKALRAVGCEPTLNRVGRSNKETLFAGDEMHIRRPLDAVLKEPYPIIVTNADASGEQLAEVCKTRKDTIVVVHDWRGIKEGRNDFLLHQPRVVVIRKKNLDLVPGATFIIHPYARQRTATTWTHVRKMACCRSRIANHKNIGMIIQANEAIRKVDSDWMIRMYGQENRIFSKFTLEPQYPTWYCGDYPGQPRQGWPMHEIAEQHLFDVDLTVFEGDGGGSQYTFLEAMDCGAVPVTHCDWEAPFDHVSIGSAEELAELMIEPSVEQDDIEMIREENLKYLKRHDPEVVGAEWKTLLEEKLC